MQVANLCGMHSNNGPSTRRRALKLQHFCRFLFNGVTSRFAELHCGSVALRCSLCVARFALLALRCSLRVALFKGWAMFNFWSFDGSVSQSNHMPVQALANRMLVCPGREIHVIGFGRVSDKLTGKLQHTPPCVGSVTVIAFWRTWPFTLQVAKGKLVAVYSWMSTAMLFSSLSPTSCLTFSIHFTKI